MSEKGPSGIAVLNQPSTRNPGVQQIWQEKTARHRGYPIHGEASSTSLPRIKSLPVEPESHTTLQVTEGLLSTPQRSLATQLTAAEIFENIRISILKHFTFPGKFIVHLGATSLVMVHWHISPKGPLSRARAAFHLIMIRRWI